MFTATARALEEYDRFESEYSDRALSPRYRDELADLDRLEEFRKAVATAFSRETGNSLDTCLQVIYPGPKVPPPGSELSFVRKAVERFKTSDSKWNPRYAVYAAHHGRSPEAMLEYDRQKYPGGCMAGFSIWIGERWQEWYRKIGVGGRPIYEQRYHQDHKAFDHWLKGKYGRA